MSPKLCNFLSDHPILGASAGFMSALIAVLEQIKPILQYAGIIMGLIISGLTIYTQIKSLYEERKKKEELPDKKDD